MAGVSRHVWECLAMVGVPLGGLTAHWHSSGLARQAERKMSTQQIKAKAQITLRRKTMSLRSISERGPVRSGPVSYCSVPSVFSPCFSVLKYLLAVPGTDTWVSGEIQPRDNASSA
jgi:hypothetical protein